MKFTFLFYACKGFYRCPKCKTLWKKKHLNSYFLQGIVLLGGSALVAWIAILLNPDLRLLYELPGRVDVIGPFGYIFVTVFFLTELLAYLIFGMQRYEEGEY